MTIFADLAKSIIECAACTVDGFYSSKFLQSSARRYLLEMKKDARRVGLVDGLVIFETNILRVSPVNEVARAGLVH